LTVPAEPASGHITPIDRNLAGLEGSSPLGEFWGVVGTVRGLSALCNVWFAYEQATALPNWSVQLSAV